MDDMKIPEGYVLIKKGGRPRRTARDIAVLMARYWKEAELGYAWKADTWIIEKFGFNESSDVRKRIKQAKKSLPAKWMYFRLGEVALIFPASRVIGGLPVPDEGVSGWIWAPGHGEAYGAASSNVSVSVTIPSEAEKDHA